MSEESSHRCVFGCVSGSGTGSSSSLTGDFFNLKVTEKTVFICSVKQPNIVYVNKIDMENWKLHHRKCISQHSLTPPTFF